MVLLLPVSACAAGLALESGGGCLGLDYGADAAVFGLAAGGGGRRGRPVVVRAVVRGVVRGVRQVGAVAVAVAVLVELVRVRVRGRVVVVVVVVGRRVLVAELRVVRVRRCRRLRVVRGLRGRVALRGGLAPLATEQGP